MITTRAEFQRRIQEVEKYMAAAQLLDSGRCELVCTDILGGQSKLLIDEELSRIFKANVFLLLYNLVESTIINSIKAIVNSVVDEHLTYDQISEEIKHLWARHTVSGVKDISQFTKKIQDVADKIVTKELLSLTHECINISGNIDAQKIRNIAKQVGWEVTQDGRELLIIKKKRNNLAHGELTFVDIGKDYSIKELTNIKDKTVAYLTDVLTKVEAYISNKRYLKL